MWQLKAQQFGKSLEIELQRNHYKKEKEEYKKQMNQKKNAVNETMC